MSQADSGLDINLESVFEKLLNDEELAYLVLYHFRVQIREELPIIEACLGKEDFYSLFERAHALKGSAAIAGAELMYSNLASLQEACRERDAILVRDLVVELQTKAGKYISCLNEIEGFISKYGNEENLSS